MAEVPNIDYKQIFKEAAGHPLPEVIKKKRTYTPELVIDKKED